MADNIDKTYWLGGGSSRAKDRTTTRTTVVGADLTPGDATETIPGAMQSYSKRYTGAVTNDPMYTPTSGKRLVVEVAHIAPSADNLANLNIVVGLGPAATPTLPSAKVIYSNPGMPPGVPDRKQGANFLIGATNEKVYVTITANGGADISACVVDISVSCAEAT